MFVASLQRIPRLSHCMGSLLGVAGHCVEHNGAQVCHINAFWSERENKKTYDIIKR